MAMTNVLIPLTEYIVKKMKAGDSMIGNDYFIGFLEPDCSLLMNDQIIKGECRVKMHIPHDLYDKFYYTLCMYDELPMKNVMLKATITDPIDVWMIGLDILSLRHCQYTNYTVDKDCTIIVGILSNDLYKHVTKEKYFNNIASIIYKYDETEQLYVSQHLAAIVGGSYGRLFINDVNANIEEIEYSFWNFVLKGRQDMLKKDIMYEGKIIYTCKQIKDIVYQRLNYKLSNMTNAFGYLLEDEIFRKTSQKGIIHLTLLSTEQQYYKLRTNKSVSQCYTQLVTLYKKMGCKTVMMNGWMVDWMTIG
jgi:hypothetical protein